MRPRLTTLAVLAVAGVLAVPVSAGAAGKSPLTASASRLNCGSQAVDAGAKPCGTITFTNTSSASVQIGTTGIEESGAVDFNLTNSTCLQGSRLEPGQSCSVDVLFNPVTTGRRTAQAFVLASQDTRVGTRLVGTGT